MKRTLLVVVLATAFSAHAGPYISTGLSNNSAGDSAMAAEIAVGYTFGKFSLEAGTFAVGTIKKEEAGFVGTLTSGRTQAKWDLGGFRLTGKLAFQINDRWSAFGTASAYRIQYGYNTAVDTFIYDSDPLGDPAGNIIDAKHTGTSSTVREWTPAIGIGMEFSPKACCSVYATLERIRLKSGAFGSGNDLPSMTSGHIGFKFTF